MMTISGMTKRGLRHSPLSLLLFLGLILILPATQAAADSFTSRSAEAALLRLTPPKPPASRQAEPVFAAVALGRWPQAYALAAHSADPVLTKVVDWIRFSTGGEAAGFEEIATFIDHNPDWPEMGTLRVNAEANLDAGVPTHRIIDWLGRHGPATPKGASWLADAYLNVGERALAERVVRRAWVERNFSARMERNFYRRYRRMLTAGDHVRRLDRLLWDGRSWEARRMLRRMRPDDRILAVARIRLRRYRGGVDWAIRRIPKESLNDIGFIYERLRWRRRKGREEDAIALLDGLPKTLPRPRLWWRERGTLARRMLRKGHVTRAYQLAKDHRQTEGATYADAEWLAGWIALRFIKDAKTAARHFERLWSKVSYPVSRARAAYWAGRAAEADGRMDQARDWYAKAGQYFTAFYGQLAMGRLGASTPSPLPAPPHADDKTINAFLSRDVVRGAKLIAASQERSHFRAFIKHLSRRAKSPMEYALTAEIALQSARPDVALRAAKRALLKNVYLIDAGWPREPSPRDRKGLERALLLALMRQESAFNPQAVSWAGARGLMQLMPATAKAVARRLNLPFSRKRLLDDRDYNLTIGTAYLSEVLSSFGGTYVLGLAAYNAGPSRVGRWLNSNGDFRRGDIDAVDWIEMIPFDETSYYVQRVIENLQVYRAIFGKRRINDTALRNVAF